MENIIFYTIIAFFISIFAGKLLIPILTELNLIQHISDGAPESHKKKEGTIIFGGFIFIIATLITMCLTKINFNVDTIIAMYSLLAFGLIGFIDDSLKIFYNKNGGLNKSQKIILLLIVSCYFVHYAYNNPSIGPSIIMPFKMKLFNLGIYYIPFAIFYYLATTNAVNLTDGIDGLVTSVTILVMVFFTIVSYHFGNYSLSIFCGIISGSLLGFLKYNRYPAKIFMGDTGALALGGVVATIAVILKLPLVIILVGGIYVFEIITTSIQIISFQLTGKRVFKKTPIHHSLELLGWREGKIVTIFSLVTAILCIIGFLSFCK